MQRRAFAILIPAVALVACGSTTSPSSSSSASGAPAATSASAATSSCNGGSTAAPNGSPDPKSFVLTTDNLPNENYTWTVVSDGELANNPSSHSTTWQNNDGSQRVEVDVLLLDSASTACTSYPSWRDTIKGKVGGGDTLQCPSDLPSGCLEVSGTVATAPQKGQVVITWVNGFTLAAVVLVHATSPAADNYYAEKVASAENNTITTASGG